MQSSFLRIHPSDNIVAALKDLPESTSITLDDQQIRLTENIQAKHKFAAKEIEEGGELIMYGVLVGRASEPIGA